MKLRDSIGREVFGLCEGSSKLCTLQVESRAGPENVIKVLVVFTAGAGRGVCQVFPMEAVS